MATAANAADDLMTGKILEFRGYGKDDSKKILIQCSATLFRSVKDHKLHLVTNAHCLPSALTHFELHDLTNGLAPEWSGPFPQKNLGRFDRARVRLDKTRDLAEISLDENQLKSYDATIVEYEELRARSFGQSFSGISLGFADGKGWLKTCGGMDEAFGGTCQSNIGLFELPGSSGFVGVSPIEILHGMSGGGFFGLKNLEGINSKFRPFEDLAIIIPMAEVEKFIANPTQTRPTDSRETRSRPCFRDAGKRSPYVDGGREDCSLDQEFENGLRDFLDIDLDEELALNEIPKNERKAVINKLINSMKGVFLTRPEALAKAHSALFDAQGLKPEPAGFKGELGLIFNGNARGVKFTFGGFSIMEQRNQVEIARIPSHEKFYEFDQNSEGILVLKIDQEKLNCGLSTSTQLRCYNDKMTLSLTPFRSPRGFHFRWASRLATDPKIVEFRFGDMVKE